MRFAKVWVLTLGIGSILVLGAPAAHANCPLLDPNCLTDVVDETVDGLTDVVEDNALTDIVDETVDGTTDVVDEVVDSDVVDETVDGVTDVVDDTVDGGEDTAKDLTDTVGDVVGSGEGPLPIPDPGDGSEPGRDQRTDRPESDVSPSGSEAAPGSTVVSEAPLPGSIIEVPARQSTPPSDGPGLLDRLGGAAAAVARQLSFPIALSLIVVAFVLFQNYLDRKDPKLAVAPIAADVMKFE